MSNEASRTHEAKTSAYTVAFPSDNGKILSNRGAVGAVTFTLPAVSAALTGSWCEFYVAAGQNVTVAGTAGQLTVFNNAGATSIAFSTAAELIGNALRADCDGTKWLITVKLGAETSTPTIA